MIPNLSDISGIDDANNTMLNNTMAQQNSVDLNITNVKDNDEIQLSQTKRIYEFDQKILNRLSIPDIQRVLTTKTYKHQRSDNYEEFEFIGDVVLKYLATV